MRDCSLSADLADFFIRLPKRETHLPIDGAPTFAGLRQGRGRAAPDGTKARAFAGRTSDRCGSAGNRSPFGEAFASRTGEIDACPEIFCAETR